jgi:FkbM family methyltransferase
VSLVRRMCSRRKAMEAPRMFLAPDDYIGETILAEGTFEKGYLGALHTVFSRLGFESADNTVALDVGANIGNHAMFFSHYFGRVHCFDPNEMIGRVLEANVLLNRADNVTVHRVALSDRDETLPYVQHEANFGGSGFLRDGAPLNGHVAKDFRLYNADSFVASVLEPGQRVACVKVDVEGLEDKVLTGLADTIARDQPLLLIEITEEDIGKRIVDILDGYGYGPLYEIHNDLRFGRGSVAMRFARALFSTVSYELRPVRDFDAHIYPMTIAAPKGLLEEMGLV